MNNIRILPMNYPVITSYPTHANILSCVQQYEDSMQWFYNYYIQLFAGGELTRGFYVDFCAPVPWRSCPWIYSQRIAKEMVEKKWDTITEFIIDCIDSNYYVFLYLDQFYISEALPYQKQKYVHDTFIFGYDKQNKLFSVADFYKYSKYYYTNIAFSQIEDAYKNLDLSGIVDNMQGIILIKPVRYENYAFNVHIVTGLINDYLQSKNTFGNYTGGYRKDIGQKNDFWLYGMDVYKLLQEHLQLFLDRKAPLDIRPFHVLLDHKTLMHHRIKYLLENNYLTNAASIYDDYHLVEKHAISLRSLAIKAYLTQEEKPIRDAIDYIPKIVDSERSTLESLLDKIIT
jgi:hypothetical protein